MMSEVSFQSFHNIGRVMISNPIHQTNTNTNSVTSNPNNCVDEIIDISGVISPMSIEKIVKQIPTDEAVDQPTHKYQQCCVVT